MKRQRVWVAIAVWSCVLGSAGRALGDAPRIGEMSVYTMPEYTLVAIDNRAVRRWVPEIGRIKRGMEATFSLKAEPTGIPTLIYTMSNAVWNRYFDRSSQLLSEFVPTRFTNYIVANSTTIRLYDLRHHYAHLYLRSMVPGTYPFWFDEGMAALLSQADYFGGNLTFRPAMSSPERARIPLERLFRVTPNSPEYLGAQESQSFFYQSWSLMHRALVADPEFRPQLSAFLQALNNFEPIEAAVQSSFGMSIKDLDWKMRAYDERSQRGQARIALAPIVETPIGAGRTLTPLEAIESIATVVLDTGLGVDRVGELLDSAEAQFPGAPGVAVLKLRLAAMKGDDAELERVYRVLEPRLSDSKWARGAGLALFERIRLADGARALSPENLAQLRERSYLLLDRALNAQPEDTEAVWAFAQVAASLKRGLDSALKRLAPALINVPRNADLAMAAALVYEAREQPREMEPALRATLRFARTMEQRRWAADRLEKLQQANKPAG